MHGLIEYSDELHPSSSHRTPSQIAEDEAGPIGGFRNPVLTGPSGQNEPASAGGLRSAAQTEVGSYPIGQAGVS